MSPEEIRARALALAVSGLAMPTSNQRVQILQTAREYARFIAGPVVELDADLNPVVLGIAEVDPEPHDVDHVEVGTWGPTCTRCTHVQGLHGVAGCHVSAPLSNGFSGYCECTKFEGVQPS